MYEMDTDQVLDLLQSDDPEEQREGAFAARDLNLQDAVPFLVDLIKSESLGVQEAADMALRKMGGHHSVQALIPLLSNDSPQIRNLAMDILRHIGHHNIDSLIMLLGDKDPDLRIFSADIIGHSGSFMGIRPLCDALLNDPEVNVRYQAAVSLGELGRTEASECLKKAFDDEEWVQYAVVEALSKIRDESATHALIQSLDDSSELVSSMIVDALGEMGNVKALPMLMRRMESSPTALRNKIVRAVINILGSKAVVFLDERQKDRLRDYLLVAIEDEDIDTQDAAVAGLGYVGGDQATSKILSVVTSYDPDVDAYRMEKAEDALVSIGFNQALVQGVTMENDSAALAAVRALGRIGSPEAVQELIQAFNSKTRDLQREISREIASSGGEELKVFFLNLLQTHEDGDIIKNSMKFLANKLRDEESVTELMPFLDHPWDDVKETALDSILIIGGEKALQEFKNMFLSTDPLKRLMAVYAFGRLGAGENIHVLKMALQDESPEVRKMALEALATICPDNKEVISQATEVMNDPDRKVRLALVDFLGGCPGQEALVCILECLHDEDEWVRIRAVESLGSKKDISVVPRILSLWENSSKLQKIKIIESLGIIGGQSSFRALLDILDDSDPDILDSAEKALDKLQDKGGE